MKPTPVLSSLALATAVVLAPGSRAQVPLSLPGAPERLPAPAPVLHGAPTLAFGNPESFAGNGPDGLDVGDLDGDGRLDVAVALRGNVSFFGLSDGTSIAVLLGRGDGTFAPPFELPAALGPRDLVVRDLDDDGHLDIAVTSGDAGLVTVHLNAGDGRTYESATVAAGTDPTAIDAGDVDGDGDLDLAVVNEGGGVIAVGETVTLLANDGAGAFTPAGTVMVGLFPADVTLADVDLDDDLDIVTSDEVAQVASVAFNLGGGVFGPPLSLPATLGAFGAPGAIAVGDVTADGLPDVLVAVAATVCCPGELQVFPQTAPGAFGPRIDLPIGRVPDDIELGDLNGDGHLDVAVTSSIDSATTVFVSDGLGGLVGSEVQTGLISVEARFADLDGDGRLDLLTTASGGDSVAVALGNGDGTFQSESSQLVPANDASALADVDGDGLADLVVAGPLTFGVALGRPDGTLVTATVAPTVGRIDDLAVADFDGDADLDLVMVGTLSQLELRRNAGDGTFLAAELTALPHTRASSVAAADLDGDLDVDLAVSFVETTSFVFPGVAATEVVVLANDGAGAFTPVQTMPYVAGGIADEFTTDPESRSAFADLDDDGAPELLLLPSDPEGGLLADRVVVFPGLGGGTLGAPVHFDVPATSRGLVLADLDGDQSLDVLLAVPGGTDAFDSQGTKVAVLYGRGDGTFEPAREHVAGFGVGSVAAIDVDEDGHLDLATVDARAQLNVAFSNGARRFALGPAFGSGNFGVALYAGDRNGDGRADLVAVNDHSDPVTVHLRRGSAFLVPAAETPAPSPARR